MDNKEIEKITLPISKRCKGIVKDPNFAVVCSFIQIFGPILRFQELSIDTIEHFFDSTPSQGTTFCSFLDFSELFKYMKYYQTKKDCSRMFL